MQRIKNFKMEQCTIPGTKLNNLCQHSFPGTLCQNTILGTLQALVSQLVSQLVS